MPKVTMFYDTSKVPFALNTVGFHGFASDVINWVAELASTEEVPLEYEDVDFIPVPYPSGTITANPIGFEIETIGYAARKEKITSDELITLKGKFIDGLSRVRGCPSIKVERPLIWMKYIDPDGRHV